MEFLDKLGLQRLWAHIVAKLGSKIDRDELIEITDNDIDAICGASIQAAEDVNW